MNAINNRQPMQILRDRSNVIKFSTSVEDSYCCILDRLHFFNKFFASTTKNRIAKFKTRCDKSMNDALKCSMAPGAIEFSNVPHLKISMASYIQHPHDSPCLCADQSKHL